MRSNGQPVKRRDLLKLIGMTAGSAVLYETMVSMGYAANSDFTGPLSLGGAKKGSSVLILGAGLAGMTAAYELRKAGYNVTLLEYNDRAGGRNWSLYGGDRYTELGGVTQEVKFAKGLYFNPGPWRIPHHHKGMLHYCRLFNIPLEPFTQVNYNAYVHSAHAFGGKPRRFREIDSDFDGYVGELLAKATSQSQLDGTFTKDEKDGLLQVLRFWGALDKNYEYRKGDGPSGRRGYVTDPGGGLNSLPVDSDPLPMKELFNSGLWFSIIGGKAYEMQSQLFQPVGGMGAIGQAFAQRLKGTIKFNCKVTEIRQGERGVEVSYIGAKNGGPVQRAKADWCICTIPASILSQIPMNVGAPMRNAINSLSYMASFKVGLQFRRRFWEEDDGIYGGLTYTDQPVFNISYPSHGYFQKGPAVLLGAYGIIQNTTSYNFEALSPQQQIQTALDQGELVHPQYKKEFDNGVAVTWHRVPWALGCSAIWTDANRAQNYENLCAIDGRIVLAGEHCSRLPAWQEGAVLSGLDAIKRLHQKAMTA